eukprot:377831-Rhodomonas_salina.3
MQNRTFLVVYLQNCRGSCPACTVCPASLLVAAYAQLSTTYASVYTHVSTSTLILVHPCQYQHAQFWSIHISTGGALQYELSPCQYWGGIQY